MSQPDGVLLDAPNGGDDWGDFSSVIRQFEQEENPASSELTEPQSAAPEVDKTEAGAALAETALVVIEQITSFATGLEFEFDAKGRASVAAAVGPVLNKHDGVVAGLMGRYLEEGTLILAIIGLMYTARFNLQKLKAEKAKEEHRESAAQSA
ncbi:hypothetical protein INR79_01610 [Vibrio sp. SCSIO 43132]|uniref:hypothetical protein n=1 Tax=Vibrio sp. SCSIO 43132 TaxID=2779363 RepID=UPI001CA903DF|nr:hypothetical protein [Vibrio sp. SCSIO 43132]UAB70650.1 hypothetical protein INR79_01610 [Vibrio sp. SCSIO 43132]